MGDPSTTRRAHGSRGIGDRGIGDRGTGSRGIGDRGIDNRGIGDRGTGDRGTGNRGTAGASAPRYLAAPAEIELADIVIGDVVRREIWIASTHLDTEASLQVALEVARDRPTEIAPFQILSAPERLRPSRQGPGAPVIIAFQAERRADYSATLTVTARWDDVAIAEERATVRLRAWSREAGEPLRADVLAAERAAADKTRADRAAAGRRAAMQARYDHETDEPYPQAKENELLRQFELVKPVLDRICQAQYDGVDVVKAEVAAFKRRPPKSNGLATALAMLAFDIATAGIAARVAAGVVKAFSQRVRYVRPADAFVRREGSRFFEQLAVQGPAREVAIPALLSEQGMAALDEMVQATVSGALGAARGSDVAGSRGEPAPTVSDDPRIEFFFRQKDAVADDQLRRATSLVEMHFLLKPFLRREADAAITAARAMFRSLDEERPTAARIQSSQTRQAWMSLLSQTSVGSLTAEELRRRGLRMPDRGATVTDAEKLARPIERGAPPPHDGVLDVYVRASRARPGDPITVERMHMNGVTQHLLGRGTLDAGLADGRTNGRFGDLRVVLRVVATAPSTENFGVVVVRDEAGNVFSSDTSGATPLESAWLARRAGHDTTSPAKQREGAERFIDELLGHDCPILHSSTDEA